MGEWNGIELRDLVLSGAGMTLRPWRAEDAPFVLAAAQDPLMHEFLPIPDPYTPADARAFVGGIGDEGRGTGTGIGCAIADSGTGELLGSAALRLPEERHGCAAIGYWVAPEARGRGIAGAVTRMLAEWGLARGLPRIQLFCDVTNLASARSAMSAGFRFEGVSRSLLNAPHPGIDAAVFARLASDPGAPIAPWLPALPSDGLVDDEIRLRRMGPGDADAVFDEFNDPITVGWSFTGEPPERAGIDSMVASAGLQWLVGPWARFVLVERATNVVAGSLVLRQAGPDRIGGIGYGVRAGFRGRRYTTRALRLLIPWAFGPGEFARLELGAKSANIASQRAALAAGFEPDGVRAARLRNPDGSFSDEVRFALVNPAIVRAP